MDEILKYWFLREEYGPVSRERDQRKVNKIYCLAEETMKKLLYESEHSTSPLSRVRLPFGRHIRSIGPGCSGRTG